MGRAQKESREVARCPPPAALRISPRICAGGVPLRPPDREVNRSPVIRPRTSPQQRLDRRDCMRWARYSGIGLAGRRIRSRRVRSGRVVDQPCPHRAATRRRRTASPRRARPRSPTPGTPGPRADAPSVPREYLAAPAEHPDGPRRGAPVPTHSVLPLEKIIEPLPRLLMSLLGRQAVPPHGFTVVRRRCRTGAGRRWPLTHMCLRQFHFGRALRLQFQSPGFEVHCINTSRAGDIAKLQAFQLVVVLPFSVHLAIQPPQKGAMAKDRHALSSLVVARPDGRVS